jgi:hypothetical protein
MLTRLWIEVAPEGEAGMVGAKAMRTEAATMVVGEVTAIGVVAIAGDTGRGEAAGSRVDGAAATAGDSAGATGAAGDELVLMWRSGVAQIASDDVFVVQVWGR